jgi:hypothetical protein
VCFRRLLVLSRLVEVLAVGVAVVDALILGHLAGSMSAHWLSALE